MSQFVSKFSFFLSAEPSPNTDICISSPEELDSDNAVGIKITSADFRTKNVVDPANPRKRKARLVGRRIVDNDNDTVIDHKIEVLHRDDETAELNEGRTVTIIVSGFHFSTGDHKFINDAVSTFVITPQRYVGLQSELSLRLILSNSGLLR